MAENCRDAPITASYPFDGADSTSDLSFVSSDRVTFFVHKVILAYASQFFKDMFTLPQVNLESSISMAEDSKTIDKILRFCYPVDVPAFDSLTELSHVVIVMVKKFLMDDVTKKARVQLLSYVEHEPLRVFAIAYTLQWTSEANDAANVALGSAAFYEDVEVPELDFVPGTVLYRLFQTYDKRRWSLNYSTDPEAYVSDLQGVFSGRCDTHDVPSHQWPGEVNKMWFIDYCKTLEGALRDAGSSYGTLDLCEPRARAYALQIVLDCRNCRDCSHGNDLVFDKVLRRLMSDLNDSVRILIFAATKMLTGLTA
ncbi:uncharacterized protein ARMOST_11274 [Armillaria ostoyae]|uniref:BTB domain-containing protein n=1 Tax=Armillaria ostoyae TaxID=47428 RepID=A0A284RGP5_ARMOS|nr:uncharacterized protein ARMOST_11274 [Armillaria ostoyae]